MDQPYRETTAAKLRIESLDSDTDPSVAPRTAAHPANVGEAGPGVGSGAAPAATASGVGTTDLRATTTCARNDAGAHVSCPGDSVRSHCAGVRPRCAGGGRQRLAAASSDSSSGGGRGRTRPVSARERGEVGPPRSRSRVRVELIGRPRHARTCGVGGVAACALVWSLRGGGMTSMILRHAQVRRGSLPVVPPAYFGPRAAGRFR